jgi:CubicO group peptidase (beta-lactamase class C family)
MTNGGRKNVLLSNTSLQVVIDRLEGSIPRLMKAATVPGLSITLIRSGEIVWSQAFGVRDVGTEEPVRPDTRFEAASLSKPLFAYASLRLCARGLLDLDTPLVEYIPDRRIRITLPTADSETERLELDVPQLERVTSRHVLSHTTGFPNWPPKESPLKIHFVPGERFSYSGMAYSVLQAVVEAVTGQTAEQYVQADVLEPLGMVSSRFVWTGQEDLPVALGHDKDGRPRKKSLWPEMIAGASLHGTSRDFARFMLTATQPTPTDRFQLSSSLGEEMLTSQVQVNDSLPWHEDWPRSEISLNERVGWGLGWGIQHTAEGTSFWHWGDNDGYKHFAVGSGQDGFGIVIMTNGEKGQDVYRRILYESIGGEYPGLDWLIETSVTPGGVA